MVNLLLQLTRESAQFQLKFGNQGFYQEALDPTIPYQLIRVMLPSDRKVYPEISVGRYGLAIHFSSPNFEGRPVRANHEIQFKLACCTV
jgi:cell division protein ZapD